MRARKNLSKFKTDFLLYRANVLCEEVYDGQATHFDLYGQAAASPQGIQTEKTLTTLSFVHSFDFSRKNCAFC